MSGERSITILVSGWRNARATSLKRGGFLVAKDHDAGERFQGRVVALGIDDAEAISLKEEMLGEESGDPRFAGTRVSRDEDIPAVNRRLDRAGGGLAEQHAPIIRAMRRELWDGCSPRGCSGRAPPARFPPKRGRRSFAATCFPS